MQVDSLFGQAPKPDNELGQTTSRLVASLGAMQLNGVNAGRHKQVLCLVNYTNEKNKFSKE
jgi:hypothetical protein